ncbi:MAG: hypothetical protein RTU63_12445, partial [Candidatus Thorarchaeota archaeon]
MVVPQNRKSIHNRLVMIISILFLCLLIANTQTVTAASNSFGDDFTTTTYMDASSTTVDGWGSGSLELPFVSPEVIGSLSIGASQILVEGNIAYVVNYGDGLYIVNITDPSDPTQLGYVDTTDAWDVALYGDYAYVVGDGVIDVINVTIPSSPSWETSIDVTGNERGVEIDGKTAFVTADDMLHAINITVPYNPVWLDSCYLMGEGMDMDIQGNIIAIATNSSGIDCVNISIVTNLSFLGNRSLNGLAKSVVVEGDHAFVACESAGMAIVDISDPTYIIDYTYYSVSDTAFDLCVKGNYLFLVEFMDGVEIVNVTDVDNPSSLGSVNDGISSAWDCSVQGEIIFIADGSNGLKVAQVGDVIEPQLVGSLSIAQAWDIQISGDYAYIGTAVGNFYIVNITDIVNPQIIGSCGTPDMIRAVAISGNFAYLANDGSGFTVVNITDPTNPSVLQTLVTSRNTWTVEVSGDIAYVGQDNFTHGLIAYNITTPGQAKVLGYCDVDNTVTGIEIRGNYAYLAALAADFRVVNITDPTNMNSLSSLFLPDASYGIEVEGNIAYFACATGGIHAVNITDPLNPALLSSLSVTGFAYDAVTDGDLLYSPLQYTGWIRVNASDPNTLENIDGYGTTGTSLHLRTDGENVFLADYNGGFRIFNALNYRIYGTYQSKATAQSTTVISVTGDATITRANFTYDGSVPAGTSVDLYLSADDGVHWEEVTNKVYHTFVYTGQYLKWKLYINTTDILITPTITWVGIVSLDYLVAPNIQSPSDGATIGVDNPTLDWDAVSGAVEYHVWCDTSPSFNSMNLIDVTGITDTEYALSGLSDGVWYWHVSAVDGSADEGANSTTRSFTVDTVSPVITLVSPTNNSLQESSIGVTVTITDITLDRTLYYWDSAPTNNSWITAPYTTTIPLGDGSHTLHVYASDLVGRWSHEIYVFTLDTVAPIINLVSPTNNSIQESSVDVTIAFTDTTLDSTLYYWDSAPSNSSWAMAPYTTTIPSGDGTHTLHVYANDLIGRWSHEFYVFTVDTTAPIITLVSPTNNSLHESSTGVTITITDTTLDSTLYYWDSSPSNSSWILAPYTTTIPSGDGPHTLHVYASDLIGRWSHEVYVFTVDTMVPVITLVSPANNSLHASS